MNGIIATRFGNTDDPIKMAKQLAESVNKIERLLQQLPIYFGENDPNGLINGQSGALYIRNGLQGLNTEVAKPQIYIKTIDGGNSGWLSLLFLGSQDQANVSAARGSLYLKVPQQLTSSAVLYLKSSNDSTPIGWTAL